MTEDRLQRRLSALVSADVVDYSRLMADDQIATIRSLKTCRERAAAAVRKFGGRVSDFVGDNMLAEFPNAQAAVDCSVAIHLSLADINRNLAVDRQLQFRIGIHLGDVMFDGRQLFGESVNIAARLEALALPGGICISDLVYKQVHSTSSLQFVDLGAHNLKNIAEPVRIFRIVAADAELPEAAVATTTTKSLSLPLPAKPSLTILPFVNLDADPEQDHFSDGLTLEVTAGMVQIPELILVSWVSLGNYDRPLLSIPALGKRLGVSHVLDGGVRRDGDRVRVTARLMESRRGRQIWAERFDRRLDDVFTIQDDITREIVTAMDVQLVLGEAARLVRQSFKNPAAIESYYRGWGALFRSSRADIYLARQLSGETIRLEPESPLGYALAAWSRWWAVTQNVSEDVAHALNQANELARESKRLKDTTGMPDLVIAQILLLNREHDQALAASEEALKVRPNCHASYAVKANILNYTGRSAEAVELARYAIRLCPVYPAFYATILANACYGCSMYAEALEAAGASLDSDPNNLDALLMKAAANAALQRFEQAQAAGRAIRRTKPDFSAAKYAADQPYKDPRSAEQIISMLKKAGL
jgi:adenylate cyclase